LHAADAPLAQNNGRPKGAAIVFEISLFLLAFAAGKGLIMEKSANH
jgi:hypothetical protein